MESTTLADFRMFEIRTPSNVDDDGKVDLIVAEGTYSANNILSVRGVEPMPMQAGMPRFDARNGKG